jgi:hypothetical protein
MRSGPADETEMVLVPRVPTKEMIEAAWAAALNENAGGVWRAMIDAWIESEKRSACRSPKVT